MKHYIRSKQRKIKNLVHDQKLMEELWDDMASRWAKRAESMNIVSATLLRTAKKPL